MRRLIACAAILVSFTVFDAAGGETSGFLSAKPVWPAGRETEMNLFVGFRVAFEAPAGARAVFRVTASSLYRAWLNGEFLGHGPARGPHGFFRIDEWDLSGRLRPSGNLVAIEVAGYNANSYYLLDQPSFFQAEVVSGGKVIASTAGEGAPMAATILTERLQRVERYSFQRTFSEVYRLRPSWDAWRRDSAASLVPAKTAVLPARRSLPRRVPYPDFVQRRPLALLAEGTVQRGVAPGKLWKSRGLVEIGDRLKGFREAELEQMPSRELQQLAKSMSRRLDQELEGPAAFTFPVNSFRILDFGTNLTGFPGATITVNAPAKVYFVFDEILTGDDVDFKRLSAVNVIAFDLEPGSYRVEAIEPYTLRYLKILVTGAGGKVADIYLREYVNPDVDRAHFASADPRLNRLFSAGRETFRQNAVDIFMDCPHRERAGWLCDSYFTARVEPRLSGRNVIEKNFFENYLLPESFPVLPRCMLPMCYPADHTNGTFIPNWSLWFVLELEEYLARSGDRETVDALRPKVLCLFDYFKKFRNPDGLLEKLPSWVFIEWSAANNFVQDVNYPSNMLYAAALDAAARLYSMPEMAAAARSVRAAVIRQSFDGEFFVDNAVRTSGRLERTNNRTEVCQYFAFYFNVVSAHSYPELWETLRDKFGPDRPKSGAYPEIHAANSFVGNMLRLELLSRYGLSQQLLDESVSYLLYMAERTGTLWENVDPSASCNHGFASHIVHTLYRDVLGLHSVDVVNKVVKLRFADLNLPWAEGEVPVSGGRVSLRWHKTGDGGLAYRVDVPAGYKVEVEKLGSRPLSRER